jgi:RHS repeat-associated protein
MGRQLQGITGTGLNASYKYNEKGLRTQKTVNGQTHEYTLLGSSVTREVIRDNAGNILWTIHYSYAGEGTPVSMNVNGTEYYYLKNAQGDITHIVDGDGNEVAAYEYDAWGNHLSVTGGDIAELNPYRYRGYRYDSETGLYYLQSRYCNPEWGRFINADDIGILIAQGELIGQNLHAYCTNDPVNFSDAHGYWKMPNWAKVAVGAVALTAAVVVTVATGGAATPLLVSMATSTVSGAVIGAIKGGNKGAIDGAVNGFMWGGIAALGGAVVSTAAKAVKTARQGVTIGRGMKRVQAAAKELGTAVYKPLNAKVYNALKEISPSIADKVSLAHNKVWIKTMKFLGAEIFDIGLGPYTDPGLWYGMEQEVITDYAKHILVNIF